MQPRIEVTREDALDSINRIKEMRLFLPLFKVGSAYIIDEAEFFFYDYTPEQKKDLWTVAIALSDKLIDANDIDIEAINKNASNMNEEFKNSLQSMFHASNKMEDNINDQSEIYNLIS